MQAALRAKELFKREVDYVVADGEVKIVDEFTGRILEGRRWSEGLHQAVEAKEGVRIKEENQTLATITLQNFFKLYDKLGGMTGTAMTEANEFWKIYKLDVIAIPPNRGMKRVNHPDVIYRTEREKWIAVADEVIHHRRLIALRRPVAAQPALLHVGGFHNQNVADELARGESTEAMRSPSRRVRTAIHPNHTMAFGCLSPHVDGHQTVIVLVALFPNVEVARGAHLVGRNVGVALVMAKRETRNVVGKREQPARFVQCESAVIGDLRTATALQIVFVQNGSPIAGDVNIECAWPLRRKRCGRRYRQENRNKCTYDFHGASYRAEHAVGFQPDPSFSFL